MNFSKLNYYFSRPSKFFQLRPISLTGVHVEPQLLTPEELKQTQCTKVVFLVLDFLDRWLREWHWQKGLNGRSNEHYSVLQVKVLVILLLVKL